MKKSVRKILSIVLILILVCTLATAVFAASNRFPLDINYDDLYEIEGLAELTQRGVSGYLAVIGPEPSTECYVNIRYKYYINNGGDLLLRPKIVTPFFLVLNIIYPMSAFHGHILNRIFTARLMDMQNLKQVSPIP